MSGSPKKFDHETALARAVEVFWIQGYEATSVEQLLSAMGISRSSMYATFGDKRALYLEALKAWTDETIGDFIEALCGEGSLETRLARAFAAKHQEQAKHGNPGCFFGKALAELDGKDPEAERVLVNFRQRVLRALRRAFERAVDEGELEMGTDVSTMAEAFMAFAQGVALMGTRDPSLFDRLGPLMLRMISSELFRPE
ncbi:MAG: TetR/AcrR family transcriptional regulator [Myxococcota bacterium]